MKMLAQFLRSLLRLRYTYPDAIQQQQARGLFWMTMVLLGVAIFGIVTAVGTAFNFPLVVVVVNTPLAVPLATLLLLVVLVGVLTVTLLNRGSLNGAQAIFVFGLYLLALLVNLFLGGIGARPWVLATFVIPQVAAGVLLRRPGIAWMSLLIAASVGGLELFYALGLLSYPPDPSPGSPTWTVLVSILAGGLLLIIFTGGQRMLLQRNLNLARELTGLTSLSQAIGETERLDEMLTRMVEMTRDQLGYYHVQIFLADEQSGILTLAAGTGITQPGKDSTLRRIAPDSPIVLAEAARGKEPLRISIDAPAQRRSEFLAATRSELLVPLRHSNELLGVLDVQSVQSDAFTEQDIEALQAICAQIAIAIQNARLAERLRDLSDERVILTEQIRSNSREIERLNQEMSGRSLRGRLETRTEKLVGYDVKEGAAVAAYNPMSLPERGPGGYSPRIETVDSVQVLVVPIVSRGQALGVMEFRAVAGQIWDDRSVELARAIAQRLALSLDNLRLFEQAQMAVAREQLANQIATLLQARSDVDSLVAVAVDSFQQALGALQTSIRLGIPEARSTPTQVQAATPRSVPAATASKNGERR